VVEYFEVRKVGNFEDIHVVVEKSAGKALNTGFYIIFEATEHLDIFKKLLDKLKDGYWDAIKISECCLIEYSVSQRIPNAIWICGVNKYGKVVDLDWGDVDKMMEMVEEGYKKVSKVERRHYVITPFERE